MLRGRPWLWLPLSLPFLLVLAACWLLFTAAGGRWAVDLLELPEGTAAERVEGSLWRGLTFHQLHLPLGEGQLLIDELYLQLRPLGALNGVAVRALRGDRIEMRLPALQSTPPETPGAVFDPAGLAALALPIPLRIENATLSDISVQRGEDDLVRFESLDLAGDWHKAIEALDLELVGGFFRLQAEGSLALSAGETALRAQATVDGQALDPRLPPDLVVRAATEDGLDAVRFELASDSLTLQAAGQIDQPLGALSVEARLAWDQLALSRLLPEASGALAATALSAGEGRLLWDDGELGLELAGALEAGPLDGMRWQVQGTVEDERLQLKALNASRGDAVLSAEGYLDWVQGSDPEQLTAELAVSWQALHWPLKENSPTVTSPQGRARFAGTLADWTLDGSLTLETDAYPDGAIELRLTGDDKSLRIERLEAAVLGGRVTGSGSASWAGSAAGAAGVSPGSGPALAAELNLVLDTMDLAELQPDWPAMLSGPLDVSFQSDPASPSSTGEPNWSATLASPGLRGQLFDEPLSLAGTLGFAGGVIEFSGVRIAAGEASVALDGRLGETAEVALELAIPAGGWLAQRVGGAWAGTVALDTARRFPVLRASLAGEAIALGPLQAESVSLARVAGAETVRLSVSAGRIGNVPLEAFSATLQDGAGELRLGMTLATERLQLSAESAGQLRAMNRGQLPGWQGRLEALALALDEAPLLVLEQASPVQLTAEMQQLDDACFRFVSGGRACLKASAGADTGLGLSLELAQLPLDPVDRWFQFGLEGTQTIDGQLRWERPASAPPSGTAALTLSAGRFLDPARPELELVTGPGNLGFELEAGRLREGRLDLGLPERGFLRSRFEVDGLMLDGSGRLNGSLEAELNGLRLVDELVPQISDLEGRLRLSLALGGQVGDPELDGGLDLSDVRFAIPALATEVKDLSLRGRVSDSDLLALRGAYRVGEGEGDLIVRADFSNWNAPRFAAEVNGEDLQLVRLSDLALDVSPALRLDYGSRGWRIGGETRIPRATVTPLTAFVKRVAESDDVVIVSGQAAPAPAATQARPAELYGSVAVTLGDEVRLRMDIADLALSGGAALRWDGDLMPTAEGEVLANGTVSAWGPKLTMTNGRVRWAGGPLTNPLLELRAERDVFGGTIVRTAGVRISGTAQRPDVAAYTRPLTTSERAWAVLLTGSDVNFAQGVGAFDVGAYIAPRVFLSYGISFFDSENVVGLRYDLRRGWGIKATSGQSESGVDLSYTIER